MDEKPKKNPKYEDIKGKLNTGPTTKKVAILSNNNVAKKRSEVFFRIHRDGLESILSIEKNQESIYNMGSDNYDTQSINTNQTSKTVVTSKTQQNFNIEVNEKTDYVLIDLRDDTAFEKYRIVEGSLKIKEP